MGEEEDYMGELSQFLPPETSASPHKKKNTNPTVQPQASNKNKSKFSKALSWQERRRLEKERKQQEEDEKTLEKIEECPIPQSNIGFKLLKKMGYQPGSGIGLVGRAEPLGIEIRRTRVGIGREDPVREKRRREEVEAERKMRKEEELMAEFGDLQRSRWRGKRVLVNFQKAQAVLDRLENKEVVVVAKKGEEEGEAGGVDEEEEEEEITEEDLQEMLMKLRDEHRYCLFCGIQYETPEALLSSCPGINEDDH